MLDSSVASPIPAPMMLGVLLVAAVAACKGDSPPTGASGAGSAANAAGSAANAAGSAAPAAPVADACAVFTAEAVGTAFGVTVTQAASNTTSKTADGLPMTSCTWEQGAARATDLVIDFKVENFADVPRATSYFASTKVTSGSMSFAEAAGIGEEAVYYRMQVAKPSQASMGWRRGTAVFTLGVVRRDGLDVADAERKLSALADGAF